MNKLEQDILNRANEKLAALNSEMEKDANLRSIVSDVAKGTAQGALSALIGTVAGNGLGAITEDIVSSEDSTGALPAVGGILGGYALPTAISLTSIGKRSIPYHIGDVLGTIGANHMLQNSALANYNINNPEQPEEDPKLASYNNMEKDAGIGDAVKKFLTNEKTRNIFKTRLGQDLGGAVTGAGAGALLGGIGNAARGFMFDRVDPKEDGFFNRIGKGISDFGTGALYGGLAGGVGGAYKAHSNMSKMLNKANDARGALREGVSENFGKNVPNNANYVKKQLHKMNKGISDINKAVDKETLQGFGSGFLSGMNSVGDNLMFRSPVDNFLSQYNNNPFMNKKWNTPVPQTPAPAAS